jgi:hypothetical protein
MATIDVSQAGGHGFSEQDHQSNHKKRKLRLTQMGILA